MKPSTGHTREPDLSAGQALLRRPVLPLAAMVEFLYMTGPFATIAEVIDELPEPIETATALYGEPRELLREYMECFTPLEQVKQGGATQPVVTVTGEPLDAMAAAAALCRQQILTRELERINSLLCGPCGCDLCCVGPDRQMAQEFFEIPLADEEIVHFPIERHDSIDSRARGAMDEPELMLDGAPFYLADTPRLVHWQNGWSLILPRECHCPNLDMNTGGCRIYPDRPLVCRRPQIFPYILEELADGTIRQRDMVLAIMDCPYVQRLRDAIAAHAAACELEIIFTTNKG